MGHFGGEGGQRQPVCGERNQSHRFQNTSVAFLNHFPNMCCPQGTNGSQLWDTCFAVQAFLEVSQSCDELSSTICSYEMNEIIFVYVSQ